MILLTGCGGGGSSDQPLASFVEDPGPSPQPTGSPSPSPSPTNNPNPNPFPTPNPTSSPTPSPRTFVYPDFGTNSRVTVVANFQPEAQTTTTTSQLVATLNSFGPAPVPRFADLSEDEAEEGFVAVGASCGTPDAWAFAEHLSLQTSADEQIVPQQVLGRYQDLPEGAEEQFFIIPIFNNITTKKVLQPNETLHCTIFAEVDGNGNPVLSRQKALLIAEAFDSNNPQRPGSGIYQQVREVFGSEWNQNPPGGLDGDMKIVMVFISSATIGNNLFGYTSPADARPNGGSTSNQGEILYINANKSDYQTLATIAHEFQHLVNINQKLNQQGLNPPGATQEVVAINEGLSGLAEEVCGFTFQSGNTLLHIITNDYLRRPQEHSFFDFFKAGLGYGQGYLFFKFVREQFGDATIRNIATSPKTGKVNLDEQIPGGFGEAFRRWTVANFATNLSGTPLIYRYPSGFRTNGTYATGQLVGPKTFPLSRNQNNGSAALNAWSTNYLVFDQGNGSELQIQIQPANNSPFGLILEQIQGTYSRLDQ